MSDETIVQEQGDDERRDALAQLIPDQRFFDSYIPRQVAGTDKTDLEVLEVAIRRNEGDPTKRPWNVLMEGPTGLGKTTAVLAVCAKNGWPCGTANLNGMTTIEDLIGQVVPTETDWTDAEGLMAQIVELEEQTLVAQTRVKGMAATDPAYTEIATAYMQGKRSLSMTRLRLDHVYKTAGIGLQWIDGLLIRLMKGHPDFEHTVFLADEINFAPPKVMAVLNGITDKRRQFTILQHKGELVTANPGFAVLAAMNPHYEGTRPLNKALQDRFHLRWGYDYDERIEQQLLPNHRRLVSVAMRLRAAHRAEELETPTSTRSLEHFVELEEALGQPFAIEMFVGQYDPDEKIAVQEALKLHLRGGAASEHGGDLHRGHDADLDDDEDD